MDRRERYRESPRSAPGLVVHADPGDQLRADHAHHRVHGFAADIDKLILARQGAGTPPRGQRYDFADPEGLPCPSRAACGESSPMLGTAPVATTGSQATKMRPAPAEATSSAFGDPDATPSA